MHSLLIYNSPTPNRVGPGEAETINAMALLRSDVLDLFMALDAGSLTPALVSVDSGSACVVKMLAPASLAWSGAPQKAAVGETIDVSGVLDASKLFVHCADSPAPGKLVAKGNRLAAVVAVVATGATLNEAEEACEREVRRVAGSVL